MDFTLNKFYTLLKNLQDNNYHIITVNDFFKNQIKYNNKKVAILRHDVDKMPKNSLRVAELEHSLGIKATFYFRTVRCSYDINIMKKISILGHEIGYHYENMDTVQSKYKYDKLNIDKLTDLAYKDFCDNLIFLRKNFKVDSICMHGSPLSKFDNKLIWDKYDYKKLNILGEPYLDLDFNNILYLTDTGRMWDGSKYSIRDKIENSQKIWENMDCMYHKTDQIINAINKNKIPNKIMFTTHPQRWNNNILKWLQEFIVQKIKNIFKFILVIYRNRKANL